MNRLGRELALQLKERGALDNPVGAVGSEGLGAERKSFRGEVLHAVEEKRMALWRERVKKINWDLFDIEMLSTGVRTDIGVKVFGPDLDTIDRVCKDIEVVIKPINGARDVVAAPVMGKGYLEIDINLEKAARYSNGDHAGTTGPRVTQMEQPLSDLRRGSGPRPVGDSRSVVELGPQVQPLIVHLTARGWQRFGAVAANVPPVFILKARVEADVMLPTGRLPTDSRLDASTAAPPASDPRPSAPASPTVSSPKVWCRRPRLIHPSVRSTRARPESPQCRASSRPMCGPMPTKRSLSCCDNDPAAG